MDPGWDIYRVLAEAPVVEENREKLRQLVSVKTKACGALSAKSNKGSWHLYWFLVSSAVKTARMKQSPGVRNKVLSDRDPRVHSIFKGC